MKLSDLFETYSPVNLRDDVNGALPPTYIIPELQNNDSYAQYRYIVALATARAIDNGDVKMAQESAWNENQAIVCYTKEDEETVKSTNRHMGVIGKPISNTPSHEQSSVNKKSPVRPYVDLD